jgi:hypothetical protein
MPDSASPSAASSLECSSFRAVHVEGIVVVRWFAHTLRAEYAALGRLVNDAAAATHDKVDLVALVSPLQSPPRPENFEATLRFGASTRESLGKTHVVLEGGSGFWRTIVQSVTTRASTALGLHGKVAMYESAEAALAQAGARRGVDTIRLRAVLERDGLLHPPPDESGAYARPSSGSTPVARRTNRF